MIRHVLRLVWHRKRHNALILLEIFFSFLVLLGVVVMAAQYVQNYRYPLGFDIDRTWRVELQANSRAQSASPEETAAAQRALTNQLLLAVKALPQVEAAAFAFTAPYENASWTSGMTIRGREYEYGMNQVSDDFAQVIDLHPLRGRFFTRDDDGVAWDPVIVNVQLARQLFGDEDPIGRSFRRDPGPHDADLGAGELADMQRERRVIGVMEDFRQLGELSRPQPFMFERLTIDPSGTSVSSGTRSVSNAGPPRLMIIKVRRGTTAQFEEPLVRTMQAVARDWSFDVQPVSALRSEMLRMYLTPLAALGTVAAFLLVMVALGLTGVLWQTVTQRTREIGLRRAKGATRSAVHAQILGEVGLITTAAVAIGIALVVQVPLLPVSTDLLPTRPAAMASLALSAAIIYGLTLLCAWYPSRMATRIEPADALRYE
jgi:putative ABC transport system permease protein